MANCLRAHIRLMVVLVLLSFDANASSELVLQLDSALRYESNPFRFSKGTEVLTALGSNTSHDWVLANDVRFSVAHALDSSETRLVFDGHLGKRDYARLGLLDHNPYAYRTGLEWRWGSLWRGAVLHSQDQKLFDYQDGSLTTRELLHRTADKIGVSLRVAPDIEFPFAAMKRRVTYDSEKNAFNESADQSLEVGVSWTSGTTSNLSAGARFTDVRFTNRTPQQVAELGNLYWDDELYLEAGWQYSAKTRLGGRIASLQREYENLPLLDFSAASASVALDHEYSPKTKIGFEAWRRPAGSTNVSTLYSMVRGGLLSVRWQATDKTRLSMQFSRELERYQTTLNSTGPPNPVLSRVRLGGGMVYAASHELSFYVDGFAEDLNRGNLGAGVSQYTLSAGLEYTFENMPGLAKRSGLGARR